MSRNQKISFKVERNMSVNNLILPRIGKQKYQQ